MIEVVGQEITRKFDAFIRWPFKLVVSKGSIMVTGYDEQTVQRDGKDPVEVAKACKEWFDGADFLVGHNFLNFDTFILNGFFRKTGIRIKPLAPRVIDTFAIAKGNRLAQPYKGEGSFLEWQYRILDKRAKAIHCRLGDLGKEFQIPHDYSSLHDALSDLELNKKVWDKLKYTVEL